MRNRGVKPLLPFAFRGTLLSRQQFPHEDGSGDGDVERFDGAAAGDGDQAGAGGGDLRREAVFFIAEGERDGFGGWPARRGELRAAAARSGADDVVAGGRKIARELR